MALKWMCALPHLPKQLEIIELKLEIESEVERKTKPKHEAHIMELQTSKYMIISLGVGASHIWKGTEVDEGKHREKPSEFGRAGSLNHGF